MGTRKGCALALGVVLGGAGCCRSQESVEKELWAIDAADQKSREDTFSRALAASGATPIDLPSVGVSLQDKRDGAIALEPGLPEGLSVTYGQLRRSFFTDTQLEARRATGETVVLIPGYGRFGRRADGRLVYLRPVIRTVHRHVYQCGECGGSMPNPSWRPTPLVVRFVIVEGRSVDTVDVHYEETRTDIKCQTLGPE